MLFIHPQLPSYIWRCRLSFSCPTQRPWISPCTAAAITVPYTSTHLRRRKRRAMMKDRGRHSTAARLSRPPPNRPIKTAVSFGSPIKRFGIRRQRESCHGNGYRKVGVRLMELCFLEPHAASAASLWDGKKRKGETIGGGEIGQLVFIPLRAANSLSPQWGHSFQYNTFSSSSSPDLMILFLPLALYYTISHTFQDYSTS